MPPSRWRRRFARSSTFYTTGETADRVAYDIAWVQDKDSPVDTINGFVEVYMDPRGMKGSWESARVLRQPREDRRDPQAGRRRAVVRGPHAVGARSTASRACAASPPTPSTSSSKAGESAPITPVGINLPNDQEIREKYGSKSVSLANVNEAYDKSTSAEFRREFAWSPEEAARAEKWSSLAGELTTDLHEVIGHGSGKIAEHLKGSPQSMLKEQYSALEESRADLVALYFLPSPRMVELGLLSAADQAEIVQAEYEGYARNALVQLRRVREGTQIEEDHMRNRQMIVRWLLANSNAIEVRRRDGKTYYVMVDAARFQQGVGGAAGRSPANQIGGRLPRRPDTVRYLRHPFRRGAPRRGGRAGRSLEHAVLHRLRPAEARTGDRSRRRHRGRQDLVPDGPESTDAGVLGQAVRVLQGSSRFCQVLQGSPGSSGFCRFCRVLQVLQVQTTAEPRRTR